MWDFSKLNLKITSDFVGIKADDNEGYAFYLPKGFDDFIAKTFVFILRVLFEFFKIINS